MHLRIREVDRLFYRSFDRVIPHYYRGYGYGYGFGFGYNGGTNSGSCSCSCSDSDSSFYYCDYGYHCDCDFYFGCNPMFGLFQDYDCNFCLYSYYSSLSCYQSDPVHVHDHVHPHY